LVVLTTSFDGVRAPGRRGATRGDRIILQIEIKIEIEIYVPPRRGPGLV
jgi:hypothetical protein